MIRERLELLEEQVAAIIKVLESTPGIRNQMWRNDVELPKKEGAYRNVIVATFDGHVCDGGCFNNDRHPASPITIHINWKTYYNMDKEVLKAAIRTLYAAIKEEEEDE